MYKELASIESPTFYVAFSEDRSPPAPHLFLSQLSASQETAAPSLRLLRPGNLESPLLLSLIHTLFPMNQ